MGKKSENKETKRSNRNRPPQKKQDNKLVHPPVGWGVTVTVVALKLDYICLFSPCRFNFEDETPTTNFDTFPAAILTVFQVKVNSIMLFSPLLCLYHWTGACLSPADPNWGGLERSHVPRDRITGGCSWGNVLLHLFHRSHSIWKLYPAPLIWIAPPFWLSHSLIARWTNVSLIWWTAAIVNIDYVFINHLIFSWDHK